MKRKLILAAVFAAVLVGMSVGGVSFGDGGVVYAQDEGSGIPPVSAVSPEDGDVIWNPQGVNNGNVTVEVSFFSSEASGYGVYIPETPGEIDVNNDTEVWTGFTSGETSIDLPASPGSNQFYIYSFDYGASKIYEFDVPAIEIRDAEGNFNISPTLPFEATVTTASGDSTTIENQGLGWDSTNVIPLFDEYNELAPLDEPITVDISSQLGDYGERTVSYSNPVYEYVWMPNSTNPTVNATFELQDRTGGQFDPKTTSLQITRAYNVSGEKSQRQVVGDVFGANSRVTATLRRDARYRIQISNENGETRAFGTYRATPENNYMELQAGEIDIDPEQVDDYYFNAQEFEFESGGRSTYHGIKFVYVDTANATNELTVTIHEQNNESNQIYQNTFTEANEVREQMLYDDQSRENKSWTVNYEAERTIDNETETVSGFQTIGSLPTLTPPVSDEMLQTLALGSLLLTAGLFGGTLSRIGGVVVVAIAWVLYVIGWLSIPVSFLLAAATIAVLYLIGTPDNGGAPV